MVKRVKLNGIKEASVIVKEVIRVTECYLESCESIIAITVACKQLFRHEI